MTDGEMAAKLEAATEPSRALAREIQCRWGGWHRVTPGQGGGKHGKYISPEEWLGRDSSGRPICDSLHGTEMERDVPDLTASLDAAVAFVERLDEQAWWSIDIDGTAKVCLPDDRFGHSPAPETPQQFAATPAMALVAAALRAIEAGR